MALTRSRLVTFAPIVRTWLANPRKADREGPDACRLFVGKCLKAASDDAVTVLGLIEDAERNRVVDPSSWISARLEGAGPPARSLTDHQRAQHETKDILNGLENFASGGGHGGPANPGLDPTIPAGDPQAFASGLVRRYRPSPRQLSRGRLTGRRIPRQAIVFELGRDQEVARRMERRTP